VVEVVGATETTDWGPTDVVEVVGATEVAGTGGTMEVDDTDGTTGVDDTVTGGDVDGAAVGTTCVGGGASTSGGTVVRSLDGNDGAGAQATSTTMGSTTTSATARWRSERDAVMEILPNRQVRRRPVVGAAPRAGRS
jgi:hypothetical protein